MDLVDELRSLASRVRAQCNTLQTEEATKNALVMPFIMALGYNVFDPTEVTPEIVADVGIKKGEKVDYAILRDGKPIILFECKRCGGDLNNVHASQLFRYFTVTSARFAILTNGIKYRFFTDLEQPNKMDEKFFLEFDLLDHKESDVEELRKFTKARFNVEDILATASELKYMSAIQRVLTEQLTNPSEEFVRVMTAQVYPGRMTPAVKSQFAQITRRAFQQFISDRINERLKVALEGTGPLEIVAEAAVPAPAVAVATSTREEQVHTTEDERDAYYVVRAILREVLDPKRVVLRDAQSYCAILLDDNNRKPICRLHFNSPKKKYVMFFNGNKEATRQDITDISELYGHAATLKDVIAFYLGGGRADPVPAASVVQTVTIPAELLTTPAIDVGEVIAES